VAKKACSEERIEEGIAMLVRIVSMLTKLIERFEGMGRVREEPVEYTVDKE
jgi:hypothetical protein